MYPWLCARGDSTFLYRTPTRRPYPPTAAAQLASTRVCCLLQCRTGHTRGHTRTLPGHDVRVPQALPHGLWGLGYIRGQAAGRELFYTLTVHTPHTLYPPPGPSWPANPPLYLSLGEVGEPHEPTPQARKMPLSPNRTNRHSSLGGGRGCTHLHHTYTARLYT